MYNTIHHFMICKEVFVDLLIGKVVECIFNSDVPQELFRKSILAFTVFKNSKGQFFH